MPVMEFYLIMNRLLEAKILLRVKLLELLTRIKLDLQDRLYIGNLNAKRDRHAKDLLKCNG